MCDKDEDGADSLWPDYAVDRVLLDIGGSEEVLTSNAVEAYARLAQVWRLSPTDAAAMLAMPLARLLSLWERRTCPPLDQDEILRIAILVDIYNLLAPIFGSDDAAIWPSLSNLQAPFLGRSPIATLKSGDFATFIEARQCVQIMWLGYNALHNSAVTG